MSLQVISFGFGRTGTLSLKAALEQLGFGPCDHRELLEVAVPDGPFPRSNSRQEFFELLASGGETD